ncbi:TPA: 16S rRNA (guanine(527)-N(7))-methyltransferase RsmG [Campylobacter coli]|uniref:16S rRNA (guanine(527)-N(7))-methyltransferase RsmG n=1 Tax=Campylobacter coli TaxID=195 RepID=UPI0013958B52|nr:16S rRNA (guanine(527)-N(7))-methyltransferase RsmG [Campylobacter coli]EDO6824297.1 16S rRNA (guanine(527)-N(7))-methyltransferase RsmG [Campylobacter coli]EDO6967781.1 16S rRNA (guanine(527)-N(7))-methyltransferase RsmG [Campylobacter coli]MED7831301.1 16S rRNA (guanine(527)-N(7))-methyltransferase RsmG [Campylobacter coli]MED7860583.1 16S rRNA (guanine(527)-N(7))-methyltransferase RsmG [Campylobacter coli]MED7867553.1 16S rRNA (guanine(527)-N(7))-methyltransferase RsmG [Campylobacter col
MNLDFLNLILSDFNEEDFRAKLKIYKEILNKFNRIHNLTQLKNIDENILDSIEILKYFDFSKAKNIVDIGSGAGFPAIFLAFILPSNFHLFEPNPKKAAFLRGIKIECNLTNLTVYKEKVENYKSSFKADIITSRALMDVKPLIKLCLNISDQKTIFILWKGSEIFDEVEGLKDYDIFENGLRRYCVLKNTQSGMNTTL